MIKDYPIGMMKHSTLASISDSVMNHEIQRDKLENEIFSSSTPNRQKLENQIFQVLLMSRVFY